MKPNPMYGSCEEALRALEGPGGLPAEVCEDFRAIRQVVLCHAWHRGDPRDFEQAVEQGWEAVQASCAGKGGTALDTGLVEPELARRPVVTYRLVEDGREIGKVVVQSNQEIDICSRGQCATHFTPPDDAATVVAAMLDILPRVGVQMEQETRPEAARSG